jgi:hypothetical protein
MPGRSASRNRTLYLGIKYQWMWYLSEPSVSSQPLNKKPALVFSDRIPPAAARSPKIAQHVYLGTSHRRRISKMCGSACGFQSSV